MLVVTSVHADDAPTHIPLRQPLLQFPSPRISRDWFCRRSTWLLAASSDSNFGEVYIIEFLKVCSLLSGIRCKAIIILQAATIKKIEEQDKW